MSRQRGVALVLVLVITGILGLLMLQIGLTARDRLARARLLVERAEAELRLRSVESAMTFTLLTQPWVTAEGAQREVRERVAANSYSVVWNFRGENFEVDGATFRIQDVSGLYSMPQPGGSTRDFARLLELLGVDATRAQHASEELGRLQNPPENLPLQSFGELRGSVGLSLDEVRSVERVATLYPAGTFNPATAPLAILPLRFEGSALGGVIALRAVKAVDESSMYRLTGRGADEFYSFHPGPALRLDVRVERGGVALRRETTLVIAPYASDPLQFWSHRRLDGTRGGE